MRNLLIVTLFIFTVFGPNVASGDQHLAANAKNCMQKIIEQSADHSENTEIYTEFIPAGTYHGVIQTFLSEQIITNIALEKPLVIGLTGSVDSVSLAEGLRLALANVSEILKEEGSKIQNVELIYFTNSGDTRYISRVAKEFELPFEKVELDLSTVEGVRMSNCGVN